jgi:hypothetical protein
MAEMITLMRLRLAGNTGVEIFCATLRPYSSVVAVEAYLVFRMAQRS